MLNGFVRKLLVPGIECLEIRQSVSVLDLRQKCGQPNPEDSGAIVERYFTSWPENLSSANCCGILEPFLDMRRC